MRRWTLGYKRDAVRRDATRTPPVEHGRQVVPRDPVRHFDLPVAIEGQEEPIDRSRQRSSRFDSETVSRARFTFSSSCRRDVFKVDSGVDPSAQHRRRVSRITDQK